MISKLILFLSSRSRRRRLAALALTAALAVMLVGAVSGPAGASATDDALASAHNQLVVCQAALSATGPAPTSSQRTWANTCVAVQSAAIRVLSGPTATPSTVPATTPFSPSPSVSPSESALPTPSPTPTATVPPTGWPGASNTGVPAGTALTDYTGPCTITVAGTVIDAKTVRCDLAIHTSGVKISRSLVLGSIGDDETDTHSFTVTDSEVSAGAEQNPAVWHTNFTVLRSNIHGGQTAVACVDLCNVRDSWLHGQVHDPSKADQHFGGFLSNGGGSADKPSLIQHNTIACDVPESTVGGGISSCSGDVNLYGDFGGVKYYSFIDNLLVAPQNASQGTPSYCAYGGTGKAGIPDHIVYQDNVFQRGLPGNGGGSHCGWWGAATNFDVNLPGDIWTGNRYQDNGEIIPAPGP